MVGTTPNVVPNKKARHEIGLKGFPKNDLVTVAMDGVVFQRPVFVGDAVSFWTEVTRIGRTSITMHVTVETERDDQVTGVTEAHVTYVAVRTKGHARRPVPIRSAASDG